MMCRQLSCIQHSGRSRSAMITVTRYVLAVVLSPRFPSFAPPRELVEGLLRNDAPQVFRPHPQRAH
jgi:hypothetical protein